MSYRDCAPEKGERSSLNKSKQSSQMALKRLTRVGGTECWLLSASHKLGDAFNKNLFSALQEGKINPTRSCANFEASRVRRLNPSATGPHDDL